MRPPDICEALNSFVISKFVSLMKNAEMALDIVILVDNRNVTFGKIRTRLGGLTSDE